MLVARSADVIPHNERLNAGREVALGDAHALVRRAEHVPGDLPAARRAVVVGEVRARQLLGTAAVVVHARVHQGGRRDRRGIAADRLRMAHDLVPLLAEARRPARGAADVAVPDARDAPHSGLRSTAEPDRDVLLDRARADRPHVHVIVLTAELHRLAAPGLAHDLHELLGPPAAMLPGRLGRREVVRSAAHPDADRHPSAAHAVQAAHHLGQDRRGPQRREQHAGAEANPVRDRGERAQGNERIVVTEDEAVHDPDGASAGGFSSASKLDGRVRLDIWRGGGDPKTDRGHGSR
jgi:hypothetical protein